MGDGSDRALTGQCRCWRDRRRGTGWRSLQFSRYRGKREYAERVDGVLGCVVGLSEADGEQKHRCGRDDLGELGRDIGDTFEKVRIRWRVDRH